MENKDLSKELINVLDLEKQALDQKKENIEKMASIINQIEGINSYLLDKGYQYILQKTDSSNSSITPSVSYTKKEEKKQFDILNGRTVEEVIIYYLKKIGGKGTAVTLSEAIISDFPNESPETHEYLKKWAKSNCSRMQVERNIETHGPAKKPYVYKLKEATTNAIAS